MGERGGGGKTGDNNTRQVFFFFSPVVTREFRRRGGFNRVFRPPFPGSGTLCASWQCLEVPRGPPPSLLVQFVGSGATLSGMDVQVGGGRYRMSLVKRRFATGKRGRTHRLYSLTYEPLFVRGRLTARAHTHTHTHTHTHAAPGETRGVICRAANTSRFPVSPTRAGVQSRTMTPSEL